MTSDNGQGVWGFIILLLFLLVFGVAFLVFIFWLVVIAIALFIVVWVLDKFRFFSLGMPKDEDE